MVNKAKDAGLTHVIIKIADGASAYNVDLAGPAVDAFKAAGIPVWGWAWLWMREPFQEAEIAAHRSNTLELDGFIINAEHPAKGKAQEARAYMNTLRELLPDLPLALSWHKPQKMQLQGRGVQLEVSPHDSALSDAFPHSLDALGHA